jgi:uncharacterized membrane protein SirB2
MPEHATLRLLHQASALLSLCGFVLRGALMLVDSPLLHRRWMRSWPHIIDTLLLVSGIWMAVNLQLHPGNSPWLAAKLIALLLYIGLGFFALRLGKTRRIRTGAFIAAIACFGYIGLVALTRSALPL